LYGNNCREFIQKKMQLQFEDMGFDGVLGLKISSLAKLFEELLKVGGWEKVVADFMESDDFYYLTKEIESRYANATCFPAPNDILKALQLVPLEKCKVVLVGQDPYHGPGQAQGLSFSVPNNIKTPPSLRNILKERQNDLGLPHRGNDLSDWAEQGVLLLNRVLTVEMSKAGSHKGLGWEKFTENVIIAVNEKERGVCFILWGSDAQALEPFIEDKKHKIIKSVHPSPLSAYRGFFNSKPFSSVNDALKELGYDEISW
jgi:uracil-DNA glycosylase